MISLVRHASAFPLPAVAEKPCGMRHAACGMLERHAKKKAGASPVMVC